MKRRRTILTKEQLSKIPQDVKLYSDPLSNDAVFTNDNIPPSAIINVQPFTLSKA